MADLPTPSRLDSGQVLQYAFDDATRTLRTNSTATIVAENFAIELDAADGDNVAISDGVNKAGITSAKELKVVDVQTLAKLTEIATFFASTLNVSDALSVAKLTAIDNKLASQLSVKDTDTYNKIIDIYTKLNTTLSVSDTTSQTSLSNILSKLNSQLTVKDADVLSKLVEIHTKLDTELSVKDTGSINKLTSIDSKLTFPLSVSDSAVLTKLTSIEQKLTTQSSGVPSIQNVPISNSATETEITLPNGCKKYKLKVRDYSANLQISFAPGGSNSQFITIPRGCSYSENFLELTTTYNKLYIQSNKDDITVECIAWV